MYIQDKVEEYSDEVFDLLDNGAHIYFCGLKGMMPGALPACLHVEGLAFLLLEGDLLPNILRCMH